MEALLLYVLTLSLAPMTSAQFFDANISTSTSSVLFSDSSTEIPSGTTGQPSAFITITRPLTTSSSVLPTTLSATPSLVPTALPPPSGSSAPVPPTGGAGFSTGYTVGTAVGGSIGGLLIISLLILWFRAHKKKKLRLSVSGGSAPSNKLGEKVTEITKSDVVPKRKQLPTGPTTSGVGTGTHVRKLDGGRTLNSANTL